MLMLPVVVVIEIAEPEPRLPRRVPQCQTVVSVWFDATLPKMVTDPVVAVIEDPLIISTPVP
jgi:hypothetical protein